MKKYTVLSVLLLAVPVLASVAISKFIPSAPDKENDGKKYSITISMTFQNMTLFQAADLEKHLRKEYGNMSKIDIHLSSSSVDSVAIAVFKRPIFIDSTSYFWRE